MTHEQRSEGDSIILSMQLKTKEYNSVMIQDCISEFVDRLQEIENLKKCHMQYLVLPDFFPVSVNRLLKSTYYARSAIKKEQYETVAYYSIDQKLKKAKGKRLVKPTIYTGGKGSSKKGRHTDSDNYCKVLYDCLTKSGMIIDDSDTHCQKMMPVSLRGFIPERLAGKSGVKGTVVYLEGC